MAGFGPAGCGQGCSRLPAAARVAGAGRRRGGLGRPAAAAGVAAANNLDFC